MGWKRSGLKLAVAPIVGGIGGTDPDGVGPSRRYGLHSPRGNHPPAMFPLHALPSYVLSVPAVPEPELLSPFRTRP